MLGKKPFRKSDSQREVKEYDEEVVEIRRVTRVVKGGRRLRFRALVVIGNRKGKLGIGTGKSTEVTGAIQKAISHAKKSMICVTLNGETIPHEVYTKYKSAKLLLMPAGPGTGIIAGGSVRKVLELAGVKNILSKMIGASNKLNNVYATVQALELLGETPDMKRRKAVKAMESAIKPVTQVPKPEVLKLQAPKQQAPKPEVKPLEKKALDIKAKKESKTEPNKK